MSVVKVKSALQEKGKILAQFFTLGGEIKATFRCSSEGGIHYRSLYPNSVVRGYHCPPVQQPYFNTVSLDGSVPYGELLNMVDHAYEFVISKMPKYAQAALCGTD